MPEIVVGRDDDDMKKYGTQGTLFIGKHLVGTGEDAHMTAPVLMDALRPHIIIITGKRGEGKSYSMGIIAEELAKLQHSIRKNICSVIIDTQGIFWTMKSASEKDSLLLKDWDLVPHGFDVDVYVPEGQSKLFSDAGVDFDGSFSVAAHELSSEDWERMSSDPKSAMQLFMSGRLKVSGNMMLATKLQTFFALAAEEAQAL